MQVTTDIFEKVCCLMALISLVAFAAGTHSWTLAICFFGIFAVQKDNYKMMFPFIDKGYSWDEFWKDKEYMLNTL